MVDLEVIAAQIREDIARMDKKQTNYEKIISMKIDEMAEFLEKYFSCEYNCPAHIEGCFDNCEESILKWLQQEVK